MGTRTKRRQKPRTSKRSVRTVLLECADTLNRAKESSEATACCDGKARAFIAGECCGLETGVEVLVAAAERERINAARCFYWPPGSNHCTHPDSTSGICEKKTCPLAKALAGGPKGRRRTSGS